MIPGLALLAGWVFLAGWLFGEYRAQRRTWKR